MEAEKEQIFREIYEANNKWLYQYIVRQIGDASYTEDVLQEVAVALLFHLEEFLPGHPGNAGQVQSWLCRVARNKVLHFWRKNYRILEAEVSTELLPELEARKNGMEAAELSLPQWLEPRDRRLIYLKCKGYSLREIAAELGISYDACRAQSHRLAERLKKYFEK